jgi:iron complex transport system substrate-binding protein
VEQALLYPADLVYSDIYSTLLTAEELQQHAIFATMPAVSAGQVGLWQRDFPVSYAGVTAFLEDILAVLRDAEKVS